MYFYWDAIYSGRLMKNLMEYAYSFAVEPLFLERGVETSFLDLYKYIIL